MAITTPRVKAVPRGESGSIRLSRSIEVSVRMARLRPNSPKPWITTQNTTITDETANWISRFWSSAVIGSVAQQFVDRGLRAGLGVNRLDDDRTVE